jgi:hypothetical protein
MTSASLLNILGAMESACGRESTAFGGIRQQVTRLVIERYVAERITAAVKRCRPNEKNHRLESESVASLD